MRPTSRRTVLASGLAAATSALAAPALAQSLAPTYELERAPGGGTVRRNVMGFRTLDPDPYFSNLDNGAILVDVDSRVLHLWDERGRYNLYPSSVPMSEDMTRRGRTSVVRKVVGPEWRPTPNMRRRDPSLPEMVAAGPDNPLGTHALYLSWTYYRIHGTHDPRKIGRQASSGCIGLYNEHIEDVFARTQVGTQVLLI